MNTSTLSLHIGNGLLVSQAFDVFGGLFLLLIGAAIFYTLATWRFRALQGEAREQHAPGLWALAVALLLGGTWLIYIGATVSKRSPFTWALIVLALAYVAHWLWKRVNALLAKMQPVAAADPWSTLPLEPLNPLGPIEPIEPESLGAASATTMSLTGRRSTSRSAGPIFIVLGLGILALALWQARGVLNLGHGIRTSGRVVELSEGSGDRSGDTFLFPVVQYTDRDDGALRFHDRTGARPSPFKVGDTVPVIYLPGKPATATIDRGPGNWAPIGWSAVMGIVLTGLGVFAVRLQK